MGQPKLSRSSSEVRVIHSTADSHTTLATSHITPTEGSFRLDQSQQDEGRKAENNEIPDGGRVAWTQVLTGHLVVFNVWGYITS
jgi:hypothetical protein